MYNCPKCGSPDPKRHPAVQFEGEVGICPDPFHEGNGMITTELGPAPVEDSTVKDREAEFRVLALQVAANRCEDVADLIKFAAECEAYLINGTVPVAE